MNNHRKCAACGVTFTPSRSDARFCGTRCRVRAHRYGKREPYQERYFHRERGKLLRKLARLVVAHILRNPDALQEIGELWRNHDRQSFASHAVVNRLRKLDREHYLSGLPCGYVWLGVLPILLEADRSPPT